MRASACELNFRRSSSSALGSKCTKAGSVQVGGPGGSMAHGRSAGGPVPEGDACRDPWSGRGVRGADRAGEARSRATPPFGCSPSPRSSAHAISSVMASSRRARSPEDCSVAVAPRTGHGVRRGRSGPLGDGVGVECVPSLWRPAPAHAGLDAANKEAPEPRRVCRRLGSLSYAASATSCWLA